MKTEIPIGRWRFKHKADVRRMAKAILLRYPLYARLKPEDAEFFLALYLYNPAASSKGHDGIIGFRRRSVPPPALVGIDIIDVYGRPHDWSYAGSLDPPKSREACVHAALRQEIIPDRDAYLAWAAMNLPDPFVCPIRGELIPQADAAADHAPPGTFKALVHGWLASRGLDYGDVAVEGGQDYGVVLPHMTDPGQRSDWVAYHAENVRWRLACKPCNSGVLRGDTGRRAIAERASAQCGHCGGAGTLVVFDPAYDGRRANGRAAMVMPAHCTCPFGRWIRSRLGDEHRDRIVDLADVLAGRSRFVIDDPRGLIPLPEEIEI